MKKNIFLLICLSFFFISGCGKQDTSQSNNDNSYRDTRKEIANKEKESLYQNTSVDAEEVTVDSDDILEMYLLDVDQGTSILIKDGEHWMLYDGGDTGTSSYVVAYLKKQGIKKLDYIIASHYDADHIGGLIGALNVFECDKVICPDYETDTDIFSSFKNMIDKNGAEIVFPECGDTYLLGNAMFTIVGPYTYSYEEENDRSICVRLEYGSTHFLMCGDAEYPAEQDMINSNESLQADVLLVSHHGSANSTSKEFLDAVQPQYALISCMLGNQYGHPTQDTLNRLKESGCKIFRTDLQNDVIAYSDGSEIWMNQEPSSDWRCGAELINDLSKQGTKDNDHQYKTSANTENESSYYVCNTNTMRFHYEYCKSVSQMSEKNKKYTSETREELIAQGYESCGNCNP